MTYQATVAPPELAFLRELAGEHRGRIRVTEALVGQHLTVTFEASSPQLRDYVYFALQKHQAAARERARVLEAQKQVLEALYALDVSPAPACA